MKIFGIEIADFFSVAIDLGGNSSDATPLSILGVSILEICGLLVALLAFALSVWTAITSIDTTRKSQRAYLCLDNIRCRITESKPVNIILNIDLKNTGMTPAFDFHYQLRMKPVATQSAWDNVPDGEIIDHAGILGPNQIIHPTTTELTTTSYEEVLRTLTEENFRIRAKMVGKYRDIFRSTHEIILFIENVSEVKPIRKLDEGNNLYYQEMLMTIKNP